MKVKPHKIKLIFMYLSFALIVYGISFVSSSFVWYYECGLYSPDCITYFLLLSYPLELSVSISSLAVFPPIMGWRLSIFGVEIMTVSGQFYIEMGTIPIRFAVEGVTKMFTWVMFSINLGFVLTWIMILYAIDKRRITKQKGGFALFHEYLKSKRRKTQIRRIFSF